MVSSMFLQASRIAIANSRILELPCTAPVHHIMASHDVVPAGQQLEGSLHALDQLCCQQAQ